MPKRGRRDLASLGDLREEKAHQLLSQRRGYYARTNPDYGSRLQSPVPPIRPVPVPKAPTDLYLITPPLDLRVSSRLSYELAGDRRASIKYIYQHVLLSPSKDAWSELGTVPYIMLALGMPKGSFGTVVATLNRLMEDPEADLREERDGKGRSAAITDGTEQAKFIYNALQAGNSIGTTVNLLNRYYRAKNALRHLSHSTLRRFVRSSPFIQTNRRKTRKSGKEDRDIVCFKARLAFARQLKEQLELSGLSATI